MAEIATFWRGSKGHAFRAPGAATQAAWPAIWLFATVLLCGQLTSLDEWGAHSVLPFLIGATLSLILLGLAKERAACSAALVILVIPLAAIIWTASTRTEAALHIPHSASYLLGIAGGWFVISIRKWAPALAPLGDRQSLLGFAVHWQFLTAAILLLRFLQLIIWQRDFLPFDVLHAEFHALMTMAIIHFAHMAGNEASDRLRLSPTLLLSAIAGFAVASLGFETVQAHLPQYRADFAILGLLTGLVLLNVFLGVQRLATLNAMVLAGMLCMVVQATDTPSTLLPDAAIQLAIFVALLSLVRLAAQLVDTPNSDASVSGRAEEFQNRAASWLVRLDFKNRLAHFPLSGTTSAVPFSEFFSASEVAPLMEFLSRVESRTKANETADETIEAELALTTPGQPPRKMAVVLLSGASSSVWLSLRSTQEEAALRERLEILETSAAKAMVREERLLSIASHEMRTPVTIMAMLAEEMKAGSDWAEVESGFDVAISRLTAILDDLRASGNVAANRDAFTIRNVGTQLLEIFQGAAKANGITIRCELAEQCGQPLIGDTARVILSLSKVMHNAIIHSRGSEVTLSAVLATHGESGTVSWVIADDGCGIAPDRQKLLFEPFTTDGSEGLGSDGRTGLGLYTARKAMRLIGGDLKLNTGRQQGAEFIVTHPVRLASCPKPGEEENHVEDHKALRFPDLCAILVEDNKLVGELTASRLRKLFGRVNWVENGADALAALSATPPDILFVDQLLPGMTGSELIKKIRASNPSVPIVGVTASTMGSECEELENAGANIAVEKPLHYAQIEMLVDDLLATSGAH